VHYLNKTGVQNELCRSYGSRFGQKKQEKNG